MLLGWTESSAAQQQYSTSLDLPNGDHAPAGTKYGNIEPGTIMELRPDEKMKFFDNPDISNQNKDFVFGQLRAAFASVGMSLEQFIVSEANYSSIRAAMLKFRRRCEQIQFQVIAFQFCRPIIIDWMDALVLAGDSKINAADYLKNRRLYQAVEWRTPKWAWVDPYKDALAEIAQIRAGIKSRSMVIEEQGYDPEMVDQEQADDNKRADELGLVLDSDARKVNKTGTEQAAGNGNESQNSFGNSNASRKTELDKFLYQ
jgi:lambda family phage portal protein